MRRQWPCSKCGFACSSTWRSMNPTKPVVCNSCKSKANSSKSAASDSSKKAVVTDTTHPTNPISCDKKPSTLLIKESIPSSKADSVAFVFGASRSDPVRVDRQQQEPKSKGKGKAIASGDGQSSVGLEDHFHTGLSLKSPSTLYETDIREEINEDVAKKLVLDEIEKLSFWNATDVKKKKRTKLPQFTLSPMERFFNQLYYISTEQEIMSSKLENPPLYDDLFIYQKCNFIPENEIGLGAILLPDPSKEIGKPGSSAEAKEVVKPEPSKVAKPEWPTKNNEASCMIDDDIKNPSQEVVRGEGSPSRHMNSTSRVFRSLKEIYAHTPGENSTGIGRRSQGRPPRDCAGTGPESSRGLRNSDEILQLDSSSLVDVPSTIIHGTEAWEVETLGADVEKMVSLSTQEEESECSVLFLLDSGDESEKTLWGL